LASINGFGLDRYFDAIPEADSKVFLEIMEGGRVELLVMRMGRRFVFRIVTFGLFFLFLVLGE
jgi:hypothetical protein